MEENEEGQRWTKFAAREEKTARPDMAILYTTYITIVNKLMASPLG
jgi:hypothetical protein